MMYSEWLNMTGIHVDSGLYSVIEDFYYDFDGDKKKFCDAYLENKDGIAEKIAAERSERERKYKESFESFNTQLMGEIEDLKKKLYKEQEWKPYEDEHNYTQKRYDELRANKFVHVMTDDEAVDFIAKETGFDSEKIEIIHNIPVEEQNRHGKIRVVGSVRRESLYESSDWNYICFEVHGNVYTVWEYKDGDFDKRW